jgi:Peptidase family S41
VLQVSGVGVWGVRTRTLKQTGMPAHRQQSCGTGAGRAKDILFSLWLPGIVASHPGEPDEDVAQVQAVLVNGQSASTSELLASALRTGRGAKLVGSQTFGKGRTQRSFELADGSLLALSVFSFTTADGAPLQDVGLRPDVRCEVTSSEEVAWQAGEDLREDLRNDPCIALAAETLSEE